ncbi:hypothetical protein MHYP_G00304830 [Metynnis hypsauchen]
MCHGGEKLKLRKQFSKDKMLIYGKVDNLQWLAVLGMIHPHCEQWSERLHNIPLWKRGSLGTQGCKQQQI